MVVGGGWWLVIGGWWRSVVVGGWWLVAAGSWRRVVAVGGWRLVADGGWSWRLAVGGPLGRSLRAVLNKKKFWFLKDRPEHYYPSQEGDVFIIKTKILILSGSHDPGIKRP